jgi:glycine cleavage system regulatory protein
VQVPPEHLAVLVQTMEQLSRDGLKIVVETSAPIATRGDERTVELECVGQDRPGIVRDITRVLAKTGANVEEIATDASSAPMSGEMLFRARIRASFRDDADLSQLRAGLEQVATDLMVEIRVVEALGTRRGQ